MKKFGHRLRLARIRAGYTSAARAASELGMNETSYRRYELGERQPRIENIRTFCEKFHVTPNELILPLNGDNVDA